MLPEATNFIEAIINEELESGKIGEVVTRFPPEPNGYLHIGHAKSMCLNFGIAKKYGGRCNLRFDDTNPSKEETEYVESIERDIRWLGFRWDELHFASDYFDRIYEYAEKLILEGKAFVCDLSADEIRSTRGTLTEPGTNSPYRERSREENLDLFRRMRAGEFADGARVLRAKIDMASPNLNMRDPVIYRILRATHHRTGDKWCIYPMYDFTHPISDAFEGITHSICTLEFEDHRPLYDWVVEACGFERRPRQIEFARLAIGNTVMSKRYLKKLVDEGKVSGWDDPRMPTLSGLRSRGIPPAALRDFCERIGVAKANSEVEPGYLDACVREYLNARAERASAVRDPVRLVVENYPEGKTETLEAEINPNEPDLGTRAVDFSRELWIEREDFSLDPPPKYFRLKKDGYVRLKNAYIVRCTGAETDADGKVTKVLCEYVPESRSGSDRSGIKVKGVIHWVNAASAVRAEFREYESLLRDADRPGQDFSERMNENSLKISEGYAEPYLAEAEADSFQLLRTGYYRRLPGKDLVLSEIVSLKDGFRPGR